MNQANRVSRTTALRAICAITTAAALFGSGCSLSSASNSKSVKPAATTKGQAPPPAMAFTDDELKELAQVMNHFADTVASRLFLVTETLSLGDITPEQHRVLLALRFHHLSAVYALVTSPNPVMQLVDTVAQLAVYRQRIVDQGLARKHFGETGAELEDFYVWAEKEALRIARVWLPPAQRAELAELIVPWVEERSQESVIGQMRMESLAGERAVSGRAEQSPKGLFSGIQATQSSIEESRMLGERAFFYLQRIPPIIYARTELLLSDLINTPRVNSAMQSLEDMAETAQAASVMVSNRVDSLERRLVSLLPALLRSPEFVGAVGRLDQANSNFVGMARSVRELDESVKELAARLRQLEERIDPEKIGKVLATHTDAVANDILSESKHLVWLATGCVAGLIVLAFVLKLVLLALSRRSSNVER